MVTGRAPKGSRWPQTLHAPCLSVLVHTAGDTPAEETASETSVDVESCWVPGGGEFNQSSKELGARRGRQPQSPADEQTAQTQRRGEGLGPPAGAPSEAKPHGALLSQRPSTSHGEAKGVLLCRRSVEETCVPGRPTLFSRQPKKGHQRVGSTQTRSLPQPREPGEGPSCLFRPTGPSLCPIAWPLGSAILRPLLRACVSSSVHTDPLDSERPGVTPASSSVHYTCRDPSSKQSPVLRTQVALTRGHWPLQQVLRLAVRPVLPRPLGRRGGRAHGCESAGQPGQGPGESSRSEPASVCWASHSLPPSGRHVPALQGKRAPGAPHSSTGAIPAGRLPNCTPGRPWPREPTWSPSIEPFAGIPALLGPPQAPGRPWQSSGASSIQCLGSFRQVISGVWSSRGRLP